MDRQSVLQHLSQVGCQRTDLAPELPGKRNEHRHGADDGSTHNGTQHRCVQGIAGGGQGNDKSYRGIRGNEGEAGVSDIAP